MIEGLTIAIAPNGEILGEIISAQRQVLRVELDLSQVSDWYLNQCRNDIVVIALKRTDGWTISH
jgi:hypothetical protein